MSGREPAEIIHRHHSATTTSTPGVQPGASRRWRWRPPGAASRGAVLLAQLASTGRDTLDARAWRTDVAAAGAEPGEGACRLSRALGARFRYRVLAPAVDLYQGTSRGPASSLADASRARPDPRPLGGIPGGHAPPQGQPQRRRLRRRHRALRRSSRRSWRPNAACSQKAGSKGYLPIDGRPGLQGRRSRPDLRGGPRDRHQRPICHGPDARRNRRSACRGRLPPPDRLLEDDLAERPDLAEPPAAVHAWRASRCGPIRTWTSRAAASTSTRCSAPSGQPLPGDVILLHGSCHNPSGVDPDPETWAAVGEIVVERELLPIVDFAYQGFGFGLREDADWLAGLARPGLEFLVCSSFSKNFALYNERVGALTIVAADAARAASALSHLKIAIRSNYSNPPAHGGDIVETILTDPALRAQWEIDLAGMRNRILGNRAALVDGARGRRRAGQLGADPPAARHVRAARPFHRPGRPPSRRVRRLRRKSRPHQRGRPDGGQPAARHRVGEDRHRGLAVPAPPAARRPSIGRTLNHVSGARGEPGRALRRLAGMTKNLGG